MNLLFVFLQAGGGGDYSFLIMMVAIFAIMYFFMIRPQNKKQKEIANFRKNLEVGQEVITAGGIYGKIKEIEDNTVPLSFTPIRSSSGSSEVNTTSLGTFFNRNGMENSVS